MYFLVFLLILKIENWSKLLHVLCRVKSQNTFECLPSSKKRNAKFDKQGRLMPCWIDETMFETNWYIPNTCTSLLKIRSNPVTDENIEISSQIVAMSLYHKLYIWKYILAGQTNKTCRDQSTRKRIRFSGCKFSVFFYIIMLNNIIHSLK